MKSLFVLFFVFTIFSAELSAWADTTKPTGEMSPHEVVKHFENANRIEGELVPLMRAEIMVDINWFIQGALNALGAARSFNNLWRGKPLPNYIRFGMSILQKIKRGHLQIAAELGQDHSIQNFVLKGFGQNGRLLRFPSLAYFGGPDLRPPFIVSIKNVAEYREHQGTKQFSYVMLDFSPFTSLNATIWPKVDGKQRARITFRNIPLYGCENFARTFSYEGYVDFNHKPPRLFLNHETATKPVHVNETHVEGFIPFGVSKNSVIQFSGASRVSIAGPSFHQIEVENGASCPANWNPHTATYDLDPWE